MELSQRRLATTVYLDLLQIEGLAILVERSKVPMAAFIREGVNMILAREGLNEFTEAPKKAARKIVMKRRVISRKLKPEEE